LYQATPEQAAEKLTFRIRARLQACRSAMFMNAPLQTAEKLDFVLAFGWRSGSPLR
jgi:hypothetical protein